MKRGNFLKSLATILLSPRVVVEVAKGIDVIPASPLTSSLFKDLQLLTPAFYNNLAEKYGNVNYLDVMQQVGKGHLPASNPFTWYETANPEQKQESFIEHT